MVISRGLWIDGLEDQVVDEIRQQKQICGESVHLKVILEICELKTLTDIYKLSYKSLEAGADFIKTSTGKGSHGSTLEGFAVMLLALSEFQKKNNENNRGIKAAGGIQDVETALKYLELADKFLNKATPENFRIGASKLAGEIFSKYEKLWKYINLYSFL